MKVQCLIHNIMAQARVDAILKNAGVHYTMGPYQEGYDLYLLDLEEAGSLDLALTLGDQALCCCGHTRIDLIKKARSHGCVVYPRSSFFKNLPSLLHPSSEDTQ